jgi:hypothetical protein
MVELQDRLEALAAAYQQAARPPGPSPARRRGRQRRLYQACAAGLLTLALVAAGGDGRLAAAEGAAIVDGGTSDLTGEQQSGPRGDSTCQRPAGYRADRADRARGPGRGRPVHLEAGDLPQWQADLLGRHP